MGLSSPLPSHDHIWARTMKTLRLCLMGLLVLVHTVVLGDAPELAYGRVSITAVNATQTTASETSKLRFTIENDVGSAFHLLEITTSVASTAVIVGRIGPAETTVLDSIRVPSKGVLDLNTSHLWVKLSGLKRALVAGEEFPVELIFGTFRLTALAHVHEG